MVLVMTGGYSSTVYAQDAFTPTPTYDPFAEPLVPENPSEYELGRNWYWHHCMACHGDVGQGLTDEFRGIWPEDHQNCWAHGCHGGRVDDEGFPIPTIVPALVSEGKLSQFSSLQTFEEFLESTHPPQDPGCLDDEQYQAIAKYVFSMNDRSLEEITPTSTAIPTSTVTPVPDEVPAEEHSSQPNMFVYIGLGILVVVVGIWAYRKFTDFAN
jgi:hypothetical protein